MGPLPKPFVNCLLIILFAVGCWKTSAGQISDSFDQLNWGDYPVGFRSEFQLDYSRIYAAGFDEGGGYGVNAPAPRPILINVWYPANNETDQPMAYREYFELVAQEKTLNEWAQGLSGYAKNVVSNEFFEKPISELDDLEAGLWKKFLNSSTRAHRNAQPADGPFPVVIYHSGAGSSFEDNSVFCEFLASCGFVVIGSAFQTAKGTGFGIDASHGSVRDMEYLSRLVHQLEFADWNRIAFAGHSAGAQSSLRAATRPDCPAKTILLLDTTVDYYSIHIPTFQYITKLAVEKKAFVDESMLVTSGPEAHFQMCDRLDQSDRTYLITPELGHNEFIAQGVWRLQILEWLNKSRPDEKYNSELERRATVNTNYVKLCHLCRDYLKSELNKDSEAFQSQVAKFPKSVTDRDQFAIQQVPKGASQPEPWTLDSELPPSPRQLLGVLESQGIDKFCQVYQQFHETHKESPIYRSNMLMCSLLCELMEADRVEDSAKLHQTAKQLGSDGVSTLRFLAFMGQLTKKPELEKYYLELALKIDPNDAKTIEKLEAFKKRSEGTQ